MIQRRLFSSSKIAKDDLGISALWLGDAFVNKPQNRADILSGVPGELKDRLVRIYSPAKTASQSGRAGTGFWKLDWDVQDKWENRLMGWTSSADPVQALSIKFRTKEEAASYAERQGFHYWFDEPKVGIFRKKVYAENYTFVPGKLRIAKTK